MALLLCVLGAAGCNSGFCAAGFAEANGRCVRFEDQTCNPACSTSGHELCDLSTATPSCTCAPGYEGVPCVWAGVVNDPSFEDVSAWTLSPGAFIRPDRTGANAQDKGVAELEAEVICNGGTVGQTIKMPRYEVAEPLIAELRYRAEEVHGVAIGFNRAWKSFAPNPEPDETTCDLKPEDLADGWTTQCVCLGEAAYQKEMKLQISASEKTSFCNNVGGLPGNIEVDRLDIRPAAPGHCPSPGEVVNPEAEAHLEGWQFDTLDSGNALAGFDSTERGVGESVVLLSSPTGSSGDRAQATTVVSVPMPSEALPSPALRFWLKGSNETFFQTELGTRLPLGSRDRSLGTLVGTGGGRTTSFCLPPWTHGNVVDLSFVMRGAGGPERTFLAVDSLAVINDASCGESTDILDPDFESAPKDHRAGVRLLGPPEQSAQTLSESEDASNGDGFLEIEYRTTGVSIVVETWVFVPSTDENTGPELTFHSKVPDSLSVPARWVVGRVNELDDNLPRGGGWKLNSGVCLPRLWANRWYRVQVEIGDGGASGSSAIPTERILLDEFEITSSAKCR